ncbi:hypothetical protein [Romboutsia sp.]|uniref:hypothetical protein n=1 Tax=Romboutsia sp. TaxID=1965302 RepID=UPI003F31F034
MYFNNSNKGSILIFTLIIFSIISVITMMCIGLNYSNQSLFKLEYEDTILEENALSGLEITKSNILKEVEQTVSNSNNEQEFNNYFLGNNFINNIKNISKTELNNVSINIPNKLIYDENGFLSFSIISTSKEKKYIKQIQGSVKIKNPFYNRVTKNKSEGNTEIINEINEEANLQNTKANIDYKKLVIVQDYKEI